MQFYSTGKKSGNVSLREAVIHSLAPDNGLYMPTQISELPPSFIAGLRHRSLQEIGYEVSKQFFGDDIDDATLQNLVSGALSFEIPLVKVREGIYSLELFHGPTMAFKDVGARFMARLLGHFLHGDSNRITVLVATSGDTGSAVASGFAGVEGIDVVILYPSGKVSEIQEKQLTTYGGNVTALEIDGVFDDCQRMVKEAFLDSSLKEYVSLTSANSINLARLIPQSVYYFYGYGQLPALTDDVIVSVPSGNFGNLTAGLIAKRMGLPITTFAAATNINDIVPQYLRTGIFSPKPSQATISNAMDVGNPSNFVRMESMYSGNPKSLLNDIKGFSFTNEQTKEIMKRVYSAHGYILDPHGAIGFGAMEQMLKLYPAAQGFFLETAHPAKFKDVVDDTLQLDIPIPEQLHHFMTRNKVSLKLPAEYDALRSFLKARA